MVIPLLDAMDITGKTLTADALLTQRKLADYLITHDAHDVFTVKDNQPNLLADIRLFFGEVSGQPAFREPLTLAHGRIEQRTIWTTAGLNGYLDFPGVGQAFVIERHTVEKKSGKTSTETVFGVTSHTRDTADAERVPGLNRGHWTVENGCHYTLDWNWDEDRCTIRTACDVGSKKNSLRLQGDLDRLQAAHRHRRWRHSGQRTAGARCACVARPRCTPT